MRHGRLAATARDQQGFDRNRARSRSTALGQDPLRNLIVTLEQARVQHRPTQTIPGLGHSHTTLGNQPLDQFQIPRTDRIVDRTAVEIETVLLPQAFRILGKQQFASIQVSTTARNQERGLHAHVVFDEFSV